MRAAQHRFQKSAPALAAGIAITLSSPHLAIAESGNKCTVFGTPQVSPALVKLENGATRAAYKRGEPIHVTLTLRAGVEGVYLPDFFGPFEETCSHGFATEVLNFHGGSADPSGSGCAFAGGTPRIKYVWLKPGEIRTWSTDLSTGLIARGHYCLYAEYLSSELLIGSSVDLPDDKALVAKGRITAMPMLIEIQ
jgi:hypothetical protein